MTEQSDGAPESAEKAAWPAVDTAFAFVLPSYQLLVSRFEAADSRIVSLVTMASSVTFAAPVLVRSVRPTVSLSSGWFLAALTLFAAIVACGLVARITGVLTLPNPSVLYETALGKSDWRFKIDAIYFSGQHFDANAKAINAKGNWSIVLTVLVVLEVVLLMVWMVR
jgi:hypothetical protein